MPIPKVALSRIELERDESLHLTRLLLSRTYSPHISCYIREVIEKIAASPTIELGGMALAVLNTTLNSIIADTSTEQADVLRLSNILYKVQQQIAERMKEILAQAPLSH
ncbi:MAG TPA: hypothetical protein VKY19_15245 [Ktedonosporobacter sp.]|jgi:ABC-type phosphate transport system permease subunit|nr:hypothetical protein [Ktedonosporobacter sp.]